MNRFVSWWKSAEGSAARAGLLTALPMVAGLVLVAQMASEAGAYFPAVYVLAAALATVGTLAFSRLRLALAVGPDLLMAGWLFSLLVISHGLTIGQLYALLAVVSLFACLAAFSGLASRIVSAVPVCIRAVLPMALGAMLVLWGMEQGRMLLSSPVHLMMLGDFADPLAYFSLLGLVMMLGLRALGVRQAVGLGLVLTALLSFIEGFWIVPPAPFYAPEGLDRAAGLFLLAGDGDAQALGVMATVAPWLFLALLLTFYGGWQALGTGPNVPPKKPLCVVCILNLLAALLGMTPMTAAPESVLAGEAGQAHPRAYAIGAAAGLIFLLSAAPLARELASFPAMLVPCVIFAGFLLLARARFYWAGADLAERTASVVLCVLVPLTYDMALGLAVAVATYVLLKVLAGRTADVTRTMRMFAALAVLLIFAESWLF